MYLGRFIVVGPDIGMYRVSSRSFPNRQIVRTTDITLTVVPTPDAIEVDNPYITYNCARVANQTAVFGNGSHVDPITEKIGLGYPARDALIQGLLTLDFEKDEYNTPRIAGTIGESSYIGIVRQDALLVERVTEPTLVATYERNVPDSFEFDAETAESAARTGFELPFDHPVCAAGIARNGNDFDFAVYNG